jgi:hypothetical protein
VVAKREIAANFSEIPTRIPEKENRNFFWLRDGVCNFFQQMGQSMKRSNVGQASSPHRSLMFSRAQLSTEIVCASTK